MQPNCHKPLEFGGAMVFVASYDGDNTLPAPGKFREALDGPI